MLPTVLSAEQRTCLIKVGLLTAIEQEKSLSQRQLAKELGIALGAANSHLKDCLSDGLLQKTSPCQQKLGYRLTPKGVVEKSRMASGLILANINFYDRAKESIAQALLKASENNIKQLVVYGDDALCDIAYLASLKLGNNIVVGRLGQTDTLWKGGGLYEEEALPENIDGVLFLQLLNPLEYYMKLRDKWGAERVIVPSLMDSVLMYRGK